ncbi:MAG: aquaporin [Promethearchaeota archaeon]
MDVVQSVFTRLITELAGTFTLAGVWNLLFVFYGPWSSTGVGIAIIALTYTLYEFSGAYMNPAFVLGSLLSESSHKLGKSTNDKIVSTVTYIIAQLVGAFAAAFLAVVISGSPVLPSWTGSNFAPGFFLEMFMMMSLTFVYLMTTDKCYSYRRSSIYSAKEGHNMNISRINHYFGLAIGCMYIALSRSSYPISRGVLNPAIGVTTPIVYAIVTFNPYALIRSLFYFGAHVIGGALAGIMYQLFRKLIHKTRVQSREVNKY